MKNITTNQKYTTIRITTETHDLLADQGNMKDSYDTVIKRLIENQRAKENPYVPK